MSTERVIVVPGIEWNLQRTPLEVFSKLCTRREVITLGDQDDLDKYIKNKSPYSLKDDGTLVGRLSEDEFLDYAASCKDLAIVVPHPAHVFIEFYGKKEIADLYKKIKRMDIRHPFFVEEEGGYDPLPRIFYRYEGKYPILGGSDAHRLYSFFRLSAVFSVETSLEDNHDFVGKWKVARQSGDIAEYKNLLRNLFDLLKRENDKIEIEKHHAKSIISFLRCLPGFVQNRFVDFPHRVLK